MVAWLCLLLVGLGSGPVRAMAEPPGVGLELPTVEALSVDPAMVDWARRVAPENGSTGLRLRRLLRGLLSRDGLELEQIVQPTLTVRQAFEQRRANCVSFAALFAALARAEGIPVVFVRVGESRPGWREEGLRLLEGHVAAAWRDGQTLRIYDFGGETRRGHEEVVPLSDLTLLALFESNRGAEALVDGRVDPALEHLERAVVLDPWLAEAWTNLGVARRHAGRLEAAARAYRRALRLDPTARGASQNLAALLRLEGRGHEARRALEASRRLDHEDALGFLHHARTHLEAGDIEAARSYYRKALELSLRVTGTAE